MLGLGLGLAKGNFISNFAKTLYRQYVVRVTAAGGVFQNAVCALNRLLGLNSQSLLKQASLVLIPDGIKEDVVYAQKPTSGLGDLTFTRASDATYTDSTGVIRRSPYNLFQQSEMFSTANWTKVSGIQIDIDAAIAPNGTTTADNLRKTSTGLQGVNQFVVYTTTGLYTESVFAKANTTNFIQFTSGVNPDLAINLTNGAITGNTGLLTNVSVQSYPNGWYRIIYTRNRTVTGSATTLYMWPSDLSTLNFGTTSSTCSCFIWGAQVVEGSFALDYFPTTNRQDVPRIDFRNADGTLSSCGRLLLEPQRTNSIRNSSMVGAVAGTPGTLPTNWSNLVTAGLTRTIVGTGTENGLPYVDIRFNGTANALSTRIDFEGSTNIAALTAQVWTNSIYSKIVSQPNPAVSYALQMLERTSGGGFVTDGSQIFTPTTSLQRFAFTRTLNGGATVANVQPCITINLTNGATYDFTIRIAAPQMELGAYATTWVPTTTAAVTRIADAARTAVGSTSLFTSEWTAFGEVVIPARGTAGTAAGYGLRSVYGSTASSNWPFFIIHGIGATSTLDFQWVVSGSIAKTANVTITYGTRFKFAATSDGTLYINGSLSSASSSLTPATPVEFGLGRLGQADFSAGESAAHNQTSLFPTRLTNAELATLTTL